MNLVLIRNADRKFRRHTITMSEQKPRFPAVTAGFLIGGMFGIIYCILATFGLVPQWPMLLAMPLLSSLPQGQLKEGSLLLAALAVGATYAVVGAIVGLVLIRIRQCFTTPEPRPAPECPICGYQWVAPDHACCPQCGNEKAFANWADLNQGHHCAKCKYDLRGCTSGRCPECGTTITDLR